MAADLAALAERARATGRLGIDTEFMPEGRYRPLLCLVQIAVGDEVVVLDPLDGLGDPAPLAAVMADPDVEVVLHAGRQDVAILRREWQTSFTNVFDTQVAAGFAGSSAQAGYTGLLHDVLKIRLAKSASFTRWDARPLTPEQVRYAREDVEHLLPLAAWRERVAAAEDRPVGAVVRDPTVVELAKRQPRTPKELAAIRGAGPEVVRRRAKEILEVLDRGRAAPPVRLDDGERLGTEAVDGPTIALAESLVRARAQAAGLAYELIAARADLAPIVVAARRGRPEPDVRTLRGWRRELVGEELLELLAGRRSLAVAEGGRVTVQ